MPDKKTPAAKKTKTTAQKIQEVAESIDPNQPITTSDIYQILLKLADALK